MKSNFEKEIYQQPDVIRNLVKTSTTEIATIAEQLRSKAPKFVLIAARGTSDNAAIYAKYLLSGINHIPVGLAIPSLYTLYGKAPDMTGGLVIGISQSGETPDVQAVLKEAKCQEVPAISISNVSGAPIAKYVDYEIILHAEEEKSVPASKTYTGQLTAIAMLVAHLSGEKKRITDLQNLGDFVEAALDQKETARSIAGRFSKKNYLVVIGRGYNYCTTFEIALKIKELSYMVAEPYSSADFRHGPIAMLEKDFPVLAIAFKGKALDDVKNMIEEIKGTEADLEIMTNEPALYQSSPTPLRLPEDLPEWLSPIVAVIPGQLLALNLSLIRGIDPDNPRSLQKITHTY